MAVSTFTLPVVCFTNLYRNFISSLNRTLVLSGAYVIQEPLALSGVTVPGLCLGETEEMTNDDDVLV